VAKSLESEEMNKEIDLSGIDSLKSILSNEDYDILTKKKPKTLNAAR